MSAADESSKLLDQVLGLIKQDIGKISELSQTGKLDHETALDLTRYAKTLLDISSDNKDREDQENRKLKSMSTDELKQLAKGLLK